MYAYTIVSALALASSAVATTSMSMMAGTSPSGAASAATPSGSATMYVVKVSNKNGDLTYTPNSLMAPVGSLVQFQFYPKNHSVVQAAFSDPCTPINKIMSNVTGIKSGFMPTKAGDPMMPGFTIPIMDEKPIWYYCSQAKHCQAGMVGVINPPADGSKTIDTFKQKAMSAPSAGGSMTGGYGSDSSMSGAYGSSGSGSSDSSSSGSSSGSYSGSGSSGSSSASSGSSGSSSSVSGSSGSSAILSAAASSFTTFPIPANSAGSASGTGVVPGVAGASGTGAIVAAPSTVPFLSSATSNSLASLSLMSFAGLGLALVM